MQTIGKVLSNHQGVGPGFDFVRVSLAISIVFFHSWTVTNQYFHPVMFDYTPAWLIHYSLVPMFFALSGFLISASAVRLDLKNFLINRGCRIVPALAVDTFVCALIIGPLFTTTPMSQYFTDREFATYFLNIFGWVHFDLPGVFKTLPVARVNGSLWTVPFELLCYLLISIMIVTNLISNRRLTFLLIFAYFCVSVIIQYSGVMTNIQHKTIRFMMSVAFLDYRAQAVTAFLLGITAYQNKDTIPYSKILFVTCAGILGCAAFLFSFEQGQSTLLRFILIPAIVYITIFTGLTPMWLPAYFRTGDYSYGIYLYHQPFLQIMIILVPAYALAPVVGSLWTFALGLPLVLAAAWMSWHLVEKPLLAVRKRFSIAAKMHASAEQAASIGSKHANLASGRRETA